jgi:hypothetical protein
VSLNKYNISPLQNIEVSSLFTIFDVLLDNIFIFLSSIYSFDIHVLCQMIWTIDNNINDNIKIDIMIVTIDSQDLFFIILKFKKYYYIRVYKKYIFCKVLK